MLLLVPHKSAAGARTKTNKKKQRPRPPPPLPPPPEGDIWSRGSGQSPYFSEGRRLLNALVLLKYDEYKNSNKESAMEFVFSYLKRRALWKHYHSGQPHHGMIMAENWKDSDGGELTLNQRPILKKTIQLFFTSRSKETVRGYCDRYPIEIPDLPPSPKTDEDDDNEDDDDDDNDANDDDFQSQHQPSYAEVLEVEHEEPPTQLQPAARYDQQNGRSRRLSHDLTDRGETQALTEERGKENGELSRQKVTSTRKCTGPTVRSTDDEDEDEEDDDDSQSPPPSDAPMSPKAHDAPPVKSPPPSAAHGMDDDEEPQMQETLRQVRTLLEDVKNGDASLLNFDKSHAERALHYLDQDGPVVINRTQLDPISLLAAFFCSYGFASDTDELAEDTVEHLKRQREVLLEADDEEEQEQLIKRLKRVHHQRVDPSSDEHSTGSRGDTDFGSEPRASKGAQLKHDFASRKKTGIGSDYESDMASSRKERLHDGASTLISTNQQPHGLGEQPVERHSQAHDTNQPFHRHALTQVRSLWTTLTTATNQYSQTQSAVDSLNQQLKDAKEELKHVSDKYTILSNLHEEQSEQLGTANSRVQELSSQLEDMQAKLATVEEMHASATHAISQLKVVNRRLETSARFRLERIDVLTNWNGKVQNQLGHLISENCKLKSELDRCRELMETVKSHFNVDDAPLIQLLEVRVRSIETTLTESDNRGTTSREAIAASSSRVTNSHPTETGPHGRT